MYDEEVLKKLEIAAEEGDMDSQHALGHYYDYGSRLGFDFAEIDGVAPDVYWYRKAAEQGHRRANKALKYYKSLGIISE